MKKLKPYLLRALGGVGTILFVVIFIRHPSFPTPDKLIIFLVFVFMMFEQTIRMLKRLLPFALIIMTYESFRGIADHLNAHVNYTLPAAIDKFLFGNLPTSYLQNWWWHGQTRWYDFVFYLAYLQHFILPFMLAIIIWKTKERYYWRFVATYLVVSFTAFLTFLAFPAAPPWLAADSGYIQPIVRISSDVWHALGLQDFPSFYNQITPNIVAAVPSLHAAWATLFTIFVFQFFGKKWGLLSILYPALIYIGTVYQGEHYAFDILAGIIYAVAAYFATPYILSRLELKRRLKGLKQAIDLNK